MKSPERYVRIVGACVLLAIAVNYQLMIYAASVFADLWVADAGFGVVFAGGVQLLSWIVLLIAGVALLVPVAVGKWLLLASLLLGFVGGVVVAWLPGASIIGEWINSPRLSIGLFFILNVGMVFIVFRFDAGAGKQGVG